MKNNKKVILTSYAKKGVVNIFAIKVSPIYSYSLKEFLSLSTVFWMILKGIGRRP